MRKLFTFLMSVILISTLSAQKPHALLPKASVAPEVGGGIDDVWSEADPINVDRIYIDENPTVGAEGETWWKGLWTDEGIYVLVNVADNDYYPYYQRADETQTSKTRYDQVEVFFDCNYEKVDGLGGWEGGNSGHYKFAPATSIAADAGFDDGTLHEDYYPDLGYKYSINANDDPHWFVEYFVPFASLKDEDGLVVDIQGEIGFEVCIVDNDSPGGNDGRNRIVWANNLNGDDDSWDNMDDAGIIELDGAAVVYMEELTLTGGDITENNETLQIGIDIYPEETTDKTLKWKISEASTAKASISADGVVTPLTNGTLIVSATSSDEFVESNEITINISGQIITVDKMNFLVDGNFDMPQENGRPNAAWSSGGTGSGYGSHTAWVEDGVFRFSPDSVLANQWDMKVRQRVSTSRMAENAGERFLIGFKMWATEEATFQLVLEQNSSWAHWGNNSAAQTANAVPVDGQSRWDITPTTEPAWFKMSFVADNLDGNGPDFCFQPSLIGAVSVYIDSLYLITAGDSALINWDYVEGIAQNRQLETLDVYPNPAKDVLNVTLENGNTNVAIYNSVGVKMEELLVEGTHHVFNVSNYSPGLYFVKANNTVVKFVK